MSAGNVHAGGISWYRKFRYSSSTCYHHGKWKLLTCPLFRGCRFLEGSPSEVLLFIYVLKESIPALNPSILYGHRERECVHSLIGNVVPPTLNVPGVQYFHVIIRLAIASQDISCKLHIILHVHVYSVGRID